MSVVKEEKEQSDICHQDKVVNQLASLQKQQMAEVEMPMSS